MHIETYFRSPIMDRKACLCQSWNCRTNDDMLVLQKRRSEPDALSAASRVLSL